MALRWCWCRCRALRSAAGGTCAGARHCASRRLEDGNRLRVWAVKSRWACIQLHPPQRCNHTTAARPSLGLKSRHHLHSAESAHSFKLRHVTAARVVLLRPVICLPGRAANKHDVIRRDSDVSCLLFSFCRSPRPGRREPLLLS